jgi:hypothetical protein
MPKGDYAAFRALDPFFGVVMDGLSKFVDGEHYFDTLHDDVLFEFRYDFPGWSQVTRGRANLMALYSGYGNNIRLDRGDSLIAHPSDNGRVVILEYEVHGKLHVTDTPNKPLQMPPTTGLYPARCPLRANSRHRACGST